jgi:ferritin
MLNMEKISPNLLELLNYRIQKEEESSRLYGAMSYWLEKNGFFGGAKLWHKYSHEEHEHADKVRKFMLDLDYLPRTVALEMPDNQFLGIVDLLNQTYEHELDITRQCMELADAAMSERNYMVYGIAQWFVTEQVEELAKVQAHLDRIEAFGSEGAALRLLDNEFAKLAK